MKVRKLNKILTIDESRKAEYIANGFEVLGEIKIQTPANEQTQTSLEELINEAKAIGVKGNVGAMKADTLIKKINEIKEKK